MNVSKLYRLVCTDPTDKEETSFQYGVFCQIDTPTGDLDRYAYRIEAPLADVVAAKRMLEAQYPPPVRYEIVQVIPVDPTLEASCHVIPPPDTTACPEARPR